MNFWNKTNKYKNEEGSSLVEALVATALTLVVSLALSTVFTSILNMSLANSNRIQATFLAEEGVEVARILRDSGWTSNIEIHSSGVPFFIAFENSNWSATSSSAYIDGTFERSVTLSDVYRDSNHDIVSSGGTLDSTTKKATVFVSWSNRSATSTKTLSAYLTNIFNN